MKLNKSNFTKKIMKKENLPRILDSFEKEEKLKKIKKKVGNKKFKKLLKLEKFYNNS